MFRSLAWANVGSNGSFYYKIDLKLPPGTNGLAPQLSLSYNSNNKSGLAGIGWQIGGLSFITLDPNSPFDSNGQERFLGPGGPLVELGDNRYHYKEGDFSTIKRLALGNNLYSWVEIKTDGTIYCYGQNKNSRIGSRKIWALNKVSDVYGNFYTVEYLEYNSNLYPLKIVYTQGNGLKKFRTVEFKYEEQKKLLLKDIIVRVDVTSLDDFSAGSQLVRIYKLDYDYNAISKKYLLVKFQEYGSDATSFFSPYQFSWTTKKRDPFLENVELDNYPFKKIDSEIFTSSLDSYDKDKIFWGDFDGDGKQDYLVIPWNSLSWYLYRQNYPRFSREVYPNSNVNNNEYDLFFANDFNGDGQTDILLIREGTSNWTLCQFSKISLSIESTLNTGRTLTSKFGNLSFPYNPALDRIYWGDFNGDGFSDFMISRIGSSELSIYQSKNNGFELKIINSVSSAIEANDFIYVADYNGDGADDFIHISDGSRSWYAYLNLDSYLCSILIHKKNSFEPEKDLIYLVDMDGDGSLDLLHLKDGHQNAYLLHKFKMKNHYSGEYQLRSFYLDYEFKQEKDKIYWGDFNGDNLSDFIVIKEDYPLWSLFLNYQSRLKKISFRSEAGYNSQEDNLYWGDFNGDGLQDFMIFSLGQQQRLFFSTGEGFREEINQTPFFFNNKNDNIYVGDYNHDNRSDFIYIKDLDKHLHFDLATGTGFKGKYYQLSSHRFHSSFVPRRVTTKGNLANPNYLNSIKDAAGDLTSILHPDAGLFSTLYDRVKLGDFNGDGFLDLVIMHRFAKTCSYYLNTSGADIPLLVSVKTPEGANLEVEYQHSSDCPYLIRSSRERATSRIKPNESSRFLVSKVVNSDGRSRSLSKEYEYHNSKYYLAPPKSRYESRDLFFEYLIERNKNTGEFTKTYYYQNNPYLAGRIKKVERYNLHNQLISSKEYHYYDDYSTRYFKVRLVKLKAIIDNDYEAGHFVSSRVKRFLEYDQFGNATKIRDEATDTPAIEIEKLFLDSEQEAFFCNRLGEIKKSSEGKLLEHQRFRYKGPSIDRKEIYLDTKNTWSITVFSRDTWGNLIQKEDSFGYGKKYKYDYDYRTFVVAEENAKGDKIFFEYNPSHGKPTIKTDLNGNKTFYSYDHLGRLKEIKEPGDDWTKKVFYNNFGDPQKYYQETRFRDDSKDGFYFEREYLDGWGDTYQKDKKASGFESEYYLFVEIFDLNPAGQILRSISFLKAPSLKNNKVRKTTYDYDPSQRIVRVVKPGGIEKKITYSAIGSSRVTQILEAGLLTKNVYDARGRLIAKTDSTGGKTFYQYHPNNKLAQIKNPEGELIEMKYNSLGQKIWLADSNLGEMHYEYNEIGLLVQEKDALGQITKFEYDRLKRLVKIDYPIGTPDVHYTFDDSKVSNGLGQVTLIEDGVSKTYFAYNQKGRPIVKIREIDGRQFVFQMEYDAQGRLVRLTYPDGEKITQDFSDLGFLQTVKWQGYPLVSYGRLEEDWSADHIYRVTGNGVETKIVYDLNRLDPQKVTTSYQGELLEDLTFHFDARGNIVRLTDEMNGAFSQSFVYDDLNRLTRAEGVYGQLDYRYTSGGNLLQKGDLFLSYSDPNHPQAVTQDNQGNNYEYDRNGNMVVRKGEKLDYDARNRLVALKKKSGQENLYFYDYAGRRIKKQREDGLVIYNIDGLYEVVDLPGKFDNYTKYFYGLKNELVSQFTEKNSSLLCLTDPVVSNLYYAQNRWGGLFYRFYNFLSYYSWQPETYRSLVLILIFAFLFVLLGGFIYNVYGKGESTHPRWARNFAPLLIMIFTLSFGLSGCDAILKKKGEDDQPWELLLTEAQRTEREESEVLEDEEINPYLPFLEFKASDGLFSDQIVLKWNKISDQAFYLIFRSENEEGEYQEIGSTQEDTFSDYKVENQKRYYYKIQAFLDLNNFQESARDEGFCYLGKSFQILATKGIYNNMISLKWDEIVGAKEYALFRAESEEGIYEEIALTSDLSFSDNFLSDEDEKEYFYKIKAIASSFSFSLSSPVLGYISSEGVAGGSDYGWEFPSFHREIVPANLSASVEDYPDKIFLQWSKLSGAVGYHLWRAEEKAGPYLKIGVTSKNSFIDYAVFSGKTYFYKLKFSFSINANSGNPKSSVETEAVAGSCAFSELDLKVSKGQYDDRVTLDWNRLGLDANYFIYRSFEKDGLYREIGSTFRENFVDFNVENDKKYYYQVRVQKNNYFFNESILEQGYSFLPTPVLTISKDKKREIFLSWTRPSSNLTYFIYRAEQKEGDYKEIGTTSFLSYRDVKIDEGRIYYYKVKAKKTSSAFSETETLKGYSFLGLKDFKVSAGDLATDIKLEWTPIAKKTNYTIYRAREGEAIFSKIATTKESKYLDEEVSDLTLYSYKIEAQADNYVIHPSEEQNGFSFKNKKGLPQVGIYFFHSDYTGNISFLTDANGKKVSQLHYKPYGETFQSEGEEVFRKQFNSHENDSEVGLLFYGARFYDPFLGRFLTADSLTPDPSRSQSFNRYSYVEGRPIDFKDENGHWSVKSSFKKVVKTVASPFKEVGGAVGDGCNYLKDNKYAQQAWRTMVDSAIPYYAYKEGGWKGALLWTSRGIVSYTYKDGFGGTLAYPVTPFFTIGVHYQQHGWNDGLSIFSCFGYTDANCTVGLAVAYNIKNEQAMVSLKAGANFQTCEVGGGYMFIFDVREKKLLYHGAFVYAKINYYEIAGEFKTSRSKPGGRPMKAENWKPGLPHVTGLEGDSGFLGEDSWFTQTASTLGIHPVGVVHDAWGGSELGIVLSLITMAPAMFVGRVLAGQESYSSYQFAPREI